jgi:hypothetical protein
LLRVAERPHLIELEPLAREVYERAVHVFGKGLSGIFEQLNQRGSADAREPGHGAKGNAFRHHLEGLGALLGGQLVHATSICHFVLSVKDKNSLCFGSGTLLINVR